ncbi:hypothetical protein CYMTET_32580 [Cymbomonas tetramitiformis]|uniref:Uncharacterized protein n=1 Tax=Cymbomonas tetramitiformis TaxID=36881 RepID=A0AAE0FES5_9CHLO|nr:hypothetical protein CYMTET_32580 [Cymbomonas tetramitiformis]
MDFGKRTLGPLLLEWWAEGVRDLDSTQVTAAFAKAGILEAFDASFKAAALRHCTRLFRNTNTYGEWYDLTVGEESDPNADCGEDDIHYSQVGNSLQLTTKDLSGDLSKEEEWEECLKCLSITGVVNNVDSSVAEVGTALGANLDWHSLELLSDVTCAAAPSMKEEDTMNGLYSLLYCYCWVA